MAPTGDQIVRVARKAAGLVLLSGGETYRAEETARHIAEAFGWHMDIIAFPTGLTMTVTRGEESASSIMRISDRTTDLSRLERVNAISRAVSDRKMTLDQAEEALDSLAASAPQPLGVRMAAAGGAAAMFALMFGGGWQDLIVAGAISALIQLVLSPLRDQEGQPIGSMIGGFLATSLAILGALVFSRLNTNMVIWSIMMPQFPGLAFTNGIRDAMRGDMLSGGARMTDALMRAVILAGGAGLALWLYLRLGGAVSWLT